MFIQILSVIIVVLPNLFASRLALHPPFKWIISVFDPKYIGAIPVGYTLSFSVFLILLRVIYLLNKKALRQEDALKPILEIQFEPKGDAYYQDNFVLRTVRISINNPSAKTIKNVKARLTSIEPTPYLLQRVTTLPLHKTHDDSWLIDSFNINPFDNEFIDIVQWMRKAEATSSSAMRPAYFEITHIAKISRRYFDPADHKITIKISANDTSPIQKSFNIGLRNNDDMGDKLWMWPV